jgi:hypothetical protein
MNFLKLLKIPKYQFWGSFGGLIVLVILFAVLMQKCGSGCGWKPTAAEKQAILNNVHEPPKVTKTETKIVYQKDIAEIQNLKGLIKILRGDTSKLKAESLQLAADYEQIKDELKNAKAQIRSLLSMKAQTTIKQNDIVVNAVIDSVYYADFADAGGWYSGKVNFNSKNTRFGVEMQSVDKYNIVYYSKKIDGKTKNFFRVENANPYTKIEGLNNFEVPTKQTKQRRLGVGVMAGLGAVYNSDRKIYMGAGVMTGLYYRIF